ncbi:hypothetical protein J3E07_001696 [Methanococcus voltae]|uniref:Uncharacterized protein n=1 Tax=Methanococcus voltae TaxID=2188 RepID=A0A8J7RIV5_METVO|nr:hypothetical protein [Methanococcus voltae]MBP2202255.1 hypothetical protein [Methanococcus voltae]
MGYAQPPGLDINQLNNYKLMGKGFLTINDKVKSERIAYVEVDLSMKQSVISTETNEGILKSVSENIDAEGSITTIKGTHRCFMALNGVVPQTSAEQDVVSYSATGLAKTYATFGETISEISGKQLTSPSILRLELIGSQPITPDKILIKGLDYFGNPVEEELHYEAIEVVKGITLFSKITEITFPATLKNVTASIKTLPSVRYGKMTKVPKFSLQLALFDTSNNYEYLQSVQVNNIMILEKPNFKASGKEEALQEQIKFIIGNANHDIVLIEKLPPLLEE